METRRNVTLNNGVSMPTLGLGVWQMSEGDETENAVRRALKAGYRLIDTATLYRNEKSVGSAIRASGIPRREVFVTTKFWPADLVSVEKAFEQSSERLDLEYVDLYLIHFPVAFVPGIAKSVRTKTWKSFEKLYEARRVRAIGISNFTLNQIEELLVTCSVPPAVNQVRFNPFFHDIALLQFCRSNDIVIESYSPLTRGTHLSNAVIGEIARVYNKSPAQIMIRWALQHGTVVIPKSSREERIKENFDVFDFELRTEEMRRLDSLS